VDLIVRPSGVIFLRRRLGATPVRRALVSSKHRLEHEVRGSLEDLLAANEWNRFVPWGEVESVRVPGMLPPHRIRFDFTDGTRLHLWAWDSKEVDTERALLHVMG
jgi:hypothetical protein